MKQFLHIATTTLVILVGCAALFVLGSLAPVEDNYSFRIVESGSMAPAIKTGSVIAVIPRSEYQVGEVVLFVGTDINPQPTTHRIVRTENGMFVTKGDANENEDYRRITEGEILGKVFLDVPYAGYAARFFGTPTGKATLAVSAIILLACTFVPWRRLLARSSDPERPHP